MACLHYTLYCRPLIYYIWFATLKTFRDVTVRCQAWYQRRELYMVWLWRDLKEGINDGQRSLKPDEFTYNAQWKFIILHAKNNHVFFKYIKKNCRVKWDGSYLIKIGLISWNYAESCWRKPTSFGQDRHCSRLWIVIQRIYDIYDFFMDFILYECKRTHLCALGNILA